MVLSALDLYSDSNPIPVPLNDLKALHLNLYFLEKRQSSLSLLQVPILCSCFPAHFVQDKQLMVKRTKRQLEPCPQIPPPSPGTLDFSMPEHWQCPKSLASSPKMSHHILCLQANPTARCSSQSPPHLNHFPRNMTATGTGFKQILEKESRLLSRFPMACQQVQRN